MGDASCLGPLAGLEKQRTRYRAAVDSLADGALTRLILVARPRASALAEAARTAGELAGIGIANQHLAINGVMPDDNQGDALASALAARDAAAISGMDEHLAGLPQSRFVLRPENLVGLAALRRMAADDPVASLTSVRDSLFNLPPLARLVDEIARPGRGLIMTMGKGGVGKTTIAAAVAVELAARGHDVLLTTTDPAAHLSETLAVDVPNLTVGRIDPAVETARYRDHVLATKGADLDAAGRAMLEEDLRSPCTEEIAVFQAFSKVIRESSRHFVVMDTAPTGHTLLLLDATGSYHRDIVRHAAEGVGIVTPMMRLQDPDRTRILIVTLPETTPVLEAARLQEDLRRAGIEPWAWVVNASLAATGTRHPLLAARAATELTEIATVRDDLSERFAVVPMLAEEPVGPKRLRALAGAEPELV